MARGFPCNPPCSQQSHRSGSCAAAPGFWGDPRGGAEHPFWDLTSSNFAFQVPPGCSGPWLCRGSWVLREMSLHAESPAAGTLGTP